MVTSFLVRAPEILEADFLEISAHLLHDIVLIQLAASNITSSHPNITLPSADPNAGFVPDSIDVWVNGLWVVSPTLSLVVALFAVLVKQWLHHYMTLPSGTPGINSHIRQYRYMDLERGRVSVIIGLLPIVMHISLGLFLSGLVLFYVPLRTSVAYVKQVPRNMGRASRKNSTPDFHSRICRVGCESIVERIGSAALVSSPSP